MESRFAVGKCLVVDPVGVGRGKNGVAGADGIARAKNGEIRMMEAPLLTQALPILG